MCSKMNPDTRDECQFCGARLKPLTLPSTSMLDLPDWSKPAAAEKTAPAPQAAEEDDWLRRLQGDAAPAPSTDEPSSTSSVDAASDWLARLNAQDESASPDSQPAAQADEDNWLARLQADSSAPAPLESVTPAAEEPQITQAEDTSDWMARLNVQAETPAAPFESQPASDTGQADNWLSRKGLSDNVDLSVPPLSEQDGAVSDWLSQIRTEAETPTPPVEEAPKITTGLLHRVKTGMLPPLTEPEPPKPATTPSDQPSWLTPQSESDSEMPDWIKGTGTLSASALPSTPPSAGSDLPDWLSESTIPAAESAVPDTSLDWLSSSTPDASKDSAQPSWLSDVSAPAAGSAVSDASLDWLSSPSTPDASKDSALPSWLSEASAPAAESATPEAPADWLSSSASPKDSTGSDWLSELAAPTPESAAPEASPDWLPPSTPSPTSPAPSNPSAVSSDSLDWLSSITSQPPAKTESSIVATDSLNDWLGSTPATSVPPTDSLDWMSSLTSSTPPAPSAPSESADSLDWLGGAPPKVSSNIAVKGVTDWLSSPEAKSPGDVGGIDVHDWLSGVSAQPPAPSAPSSPAITLPPEDRSLLEASTTESALPSGLPDWLDAMRPSGLDAFPSTTSASTTDSAASLIPAFPDLSPLPIEPSTEPIVKDVSSPNLPNWLKAMKPVDEHAPETDMGMDHEESAGPLAGMRGTLLAETVMTMAGKPGESVERLIVTDAQAKHAEIFARIIQEETEEIVPRVRTKSKFAYALDRLLITLLMVALVVLPNFVGVDVVSQPSKLSAAGASFYSQINDDKKLSSNQIVLVALDYEVGYSSELNPAMEAVLVNLLRRNVRVAMVSSSPLGAVMAQEILTRAVREVEIERGVKDTRFADDYGKKFIHLGYIPGGVIGLQNFVSSPQETVTTDFVQGKSLWTDQTLLKDLKSGVGDFGLIVVAASSAETAQGWIEQVGALTKGKIAAITSASSAPLLYPYYSNKQLLGMLTGMPDAIAYNKTANRKTTVGERWQGYALGVNAVSGILVLGALISVAMLIVIRRREQEEAAKAVVTAPRPKVVATDKPVFKKTVRSNGKAPVTKKAATKRPAKGGAKKVVKKRK